MDANKFSRDDTGSTQPHPGFLRGRPLYLWEAAL